MGKKKNLHRKGKGSGNRHARGGSEVRGKKRPKLLAGRQKKSGSSDKGRLERRERLVSSKGKSKPNQKERRFAQSNDQ